MGYTLYNYYIANYAITNKYNDKFYNNNANIERIMKGS